MRWLSVPRPVPPFKAPKDGDMRTTLKFAWLPRGCTDGYTYWLSDIYVQQQYVVVAGFFLYDAGWEDVAYYGSIYDTPAFVTDPENDF